MGQYCDSKALEAAWFDWLLASATPDLEPFRGRGLLYTKVLGTVKIDGPGNTVKTFPDPVYQTRSHCLLLSCGTSPEMSKDRQPIYFNSYAGRLSKPVEFHGNRPVAMALPDPASPLVRPASSQLIERVAANGYRQERPQQASWDYMLVEIWKICQGIASKFNLPNDDAKADLANDALVQVTSKIKSRRLVYTPGRAPVFNLLTTTIHRIVFSILNREAKMRQNAAQNASLLKGFAANSHRRPIGRRIVTVRRYGSLVACPG